VGRDEASNVDLRQVLRRDRGCVVVGSFRHG
jgi:hypothetical protein